MAFPATESVTPQVTTQVTMQVTLQVEALLKVLTGEHMSQELQDKLGLTDRKILSENYLRPALEAGLIEQIIPDKPNSSNQNIG